MSERSVDDEIDEQSANVLPDREAMSIIDPTIITKGFLPPQPASGDTNDGATPADG